MVKNHNKKWAQNTVGGSSKERRQERARVLDGFNTPKIAVIELLRKEKFQHRIWEPANGYGKISKVLQRKGYQVFTSDIYRWIPETQRQRAFQNFWKPRGGDIITNPPFSLAQLFVEAAMRLLKSGRKLALLLRLQFLESKKRKLLFEKFPPKKIWVFSGRLPRMHQFGWKGNKGGSILAFAWFIWEKGYKGPTAIGWI